MYLNLSFIIAPMIFSYQNYEIIYLKLYKPRSEYLKARNSRIQQSGFQNMSKALENTLLWLLSGSRGGKRRADIIITLRNRPMNARQIQKEVGLDYKTIRYHLDLLVENNILTTLGERYGLLYLISPALDAEFVLFEDIWGKISPDNKIINTIQTTVKEIQENDP